MIKSKYIIIFFTIFLLSCKKEVVVFDMLPNEQLEMPLLLNINGKPAFLDAQNKMFRYSLSKNNLLQFDAVVSFDDISEVWIDDKKILNGNVHHFGDITINKPYKVVFRTNKKDFNFKLYFTNLPTVQVTTLTKINTDPKSIARINICHPNPTQINTVSYIGIETRGQSTSGLNKKSYGFKPLQDFDLNAVSSKSFFTNYATDNYVLNAMMREPSRVRNKASLDVWNEIANIPLAEQINTELIELFINNELVGVYHFHQNYSSELLNFSASSFLAKGKEISEKTQFYEVDNGNATRYWNDWEQVFPKPSENLNWGAFQNLTNLVVDGTPAELQSEIPQMLNIDNAVDYFLLMQIIQGGDNLAKNWLFSKLDASSKFNIYPWDLDATWGRNHRGDIIEDKSIPRNGLFIKLLDYNVGDFKTKVKSRWAQLRQTTFSASNLKQIFEADIKQIELSGIITWENFKWGTNVNLIMERIYLNQWIDENLVFLDNKIPNL